VLQCSGSKEACTSRLHSHIQIAAAAILLLLLLYIEGSVHEQYRLQYSTECTSRLTTRTEVLMFLECYSKQSYSRQGNNSEQRGSDSVASRHECVCQCHNNITSRSAAAAAAVPTTTCGGYLLLAVPVALQY
jgi:hypothetical protein